MSIYAVANNIVKATGYLPQRIVFNIKTYYENKARQGRKIIGPAIIICNHHTVYDYAGLLFLFWNRTLRVQMAEVLFEKKPLGIFLKAMGGIYVNRDITDYGFIDESESILRKGGVVGIFPESRIPREGEEKPLPFAPSAAYLALRSGFKVIPVYTNGKYFSKERARMVIGVPMNASDYVDESLTDKENIERVTEAFRDKIIELGKLIEQ